jgi:hypothetical protein
MRNIVNNPDIKDKSKSIEARKRIEVVSILEFISDFVSIGNGAFSRT